MHDLIEGDLRKNFVDSPTVRQVTFDEGETSRQFFDFRKVAALERWIVKIVEIIENPHGMTMAQESLRKMRANKAGPAGEEKIHQTIAPVSFAYPLPRPMLL